MGGADRDLGKVAQEAWHCEMIEIATDGFTELVAEEIAEIAADKRAVRIRTLGGRAFTMAIDAEATVWQLKRILQTEHGIPKKTQVFFVENEVVASDKTLADLHSCGVLEVMMIRTPASCRGCGHKGRLKRCSACDCYYCGAACQRADWKRHKRLDGCGWLSGRGSDVQNAFVPALELQLRVRVLNELDE